MNHLNMYDYIWTGICRCVTPEIDWENNDEFYPIDLRGAITVFGRTKRGRPVCITGAESAPKMSKWGRKAPPQFGHDKIRMKVSIKVGAESAPKITKWGQKAPPK